MSKLPEKLLAKSKKGNVEVTLEAHLLDTEKAAQLIFSLDGRWGKNWCRFFNIKSEELQQKFLLNLRVAALFHDIGKANEDFYQAVIASGFKPQTLRHEHLSALILCLPEVCQWLAQNSRLDINVITAAVLSHHLKASREGTTTSNGKSYKWCQPQGKSSLELYLNHPEVIRILKRIAEIANLDSKSLPFLPKTPWSNSTLWDKAFVAGTNAGDDFEDDIQEDRERRSLLVAVKAALIVSDAAASGLVRESKNIENWIKEVVHSKSISDEDIADAIINPRIEQIKAKTGVFKLATFQKQIAKQGSKALLLAACGTGKTLGAWKWAEEQSKEYEIGKVIFLYPTRGTATEGFRDYVGWSPATDAALVTGTARYELEAMQENPSEAIDGKDFQTDERLYALGFWSRRYFSATVDQFLSFLEHSYQSLCLLPVLADSAVIIDEVHSFDRRMFDSLVSFLENFNIPVLCMTATLPPSRQQRLKKAGLTIYPTEIDRHLLPDLEEKERHPRYYLELVDNFAAAFDKAVIAYQQDERVLWVVNTVDRCLAIAQKLKNDPQLKERNAEVLTYHSRFRLRDRQKVHSRTVEAFAIQKDMEARKPVIAVTTQVCEMSLDLDADVLITEVAPIPSLVQRFGRANRHLARGLDFRAKLYTYPAVKNLPYQKDELELAKKFLQDLSYEEVSQRQLAQALENYSTPEREADGSARFLESGYYAIPGSFRNIDEFSVPCILDKDLDTVKAILNSSEKYRKEPFIIDVPKKWVNPKETYPSWLPKYLSVATWEGHYNEASGFMTKILEEVELG
ncbi:CRISPR-associated helicase Cas3' [Microcystis aeruginosa BLCCF158]|uniref:CRISPR-associated helicase Cas3 n=1 Tax=Microcystis aeruginosa BLCC-F158 TaxID=2755316 RepID=A0A841UTS5_MICAE|nr:CRISPR-associated helicase Cas3' [Microcystis aeruginosa]MBC1194411.1 CRISPR-associated helicase Cas3' [Microcystis aeruginosa BLCC-F158]